MFSPTVSNSCSMSLTLPSAICTLNSSLQFFLLNSKLSGQLIKLLLIVAGHLCCFSQVFVSLLNLNLIPHCLVLKVFDFLQDTISFLGSHGQFGDCLCKVGISFLCLFLHQHDSSGQGADFLFSVLESLFLLFKSSKSFSQLVIGLIKVAFIVLDLFTQVTNVTLISVTLSVGLLSLTFILVNGGI